MSNDGELFEKQYRIKKDMLSDIHEMTQIRDCLDTLISTMWRQVEYAATNPVHRDLAAKVHTATENIERALDGLTTLNDTVRSLATGLSAVTEFTTLVVPPYRQDVLDALSAAGVKFDLESES